ncbi:MAG: Uma2 family endonuclease [Lachnospiraceae bacterium]|nr:Uma2 family endonuclease [Lachnospiraceae bacterium]
MQLSELLKMKELYGFTCEHIAEISGVPLSTVQKFFAGVTKVPRQDTIKALSAAFERVRAESGSSYTSGNPAGPGAGCVTESGPLYGVTKGTSAFKPEKSGRTLEDYLALPNDVRVELIDGVFYDMASPTLVHQRIAFEIAKAFDSHIVSNKGSCVVFIAPADVQLDRDDKTVVQPDVFVVCDRSKMTRPRVVGAPDLIVEILSPANGLRYMVKKLLKYKKAGVREYWIIDPEEMCVYVYLFEKNDLPAEYTFDDKVPVGIWDGKCAVDFKDIYGRIEFLL